MGRLLEIVTFFFYNPDNQKIHLREYAFFN